MSHRDFYENLADKTGDDRETIERLGFELYEPDRKEQKRQRRLKQWRQARRDRQLATIAARTAQS